MRLSLLCSVQQLHSPWGQHSLFKRALDLVPHQPQRLFTSLTLRHSYQPSKKAKKLFSVSSSESHQDKGTVSPHSLGSMAWGPGSINSPCSKARVLPFGPTISSSCSLWWPHWWRRVPPGKMWARWCHGRRQSQNADPDLGSGRSLLKFKANKWNKIH